MVNRALVGKRKFRPIKFEPIRIYERHLSKIDAEGPSSFRQRVGMVKMQMRRMVDADHQGLPVHFNEQWAKDGESVTIEARVYNTLEGEDETTGQD